VQLGQLRTGELTEHGSGHPLLDEHPVDGPQPDRGQGGERQVGVVASAHVEDLTVDGGIPNRPGPDRAEKLQRGQGIDQVPVPLLPDARCGVRVGSEAQHSHRCVEGDLQEHLHRHRLTARRVQAQLQQFEHLRPVVPERDEGRSLALGVTSHVPGEGREQLPP
jgi:hypothetical protein